MVNVNVGLRVGLTSHTAFLQTLMTSCNRDRP